MCELCLDSREGSAYKRTKAPRFGPRGGGEGGRERNRRVYGSQNQHMHAPLLSAQVTSSSSYLSFFSMQQHPTQPMPSPSTRRLLDGVVMPVRHRSTEQDGRTRRTG